MIRAAARKLETRPSAPQELAEKDDSSRARLAVGRSVKSGELPDPGARLRQLNAAIAFLKTKGLLVQVVDREALVRKYTITGSFNHYLLTDVIARARREGWDG